MGSRQTADRQTEKADMICNQTERQLDKLTKEKTAVKQL